MLAIMSHQAKNEEFQDLVLENINSMYNLAYRLTQNAEDANDLVQDASLRAYRFFGKFEKGTNFKAWILTILRNLFINRYRKHKKEPNKVSYEKIEGFVEMPQTSGFEEEVFGEQLQTSINELSEELQTVINLFYVEGLSYKEIAKVMACPIGTVMSRLHMARNHLKKKLSFIKKNRFSA